MWPGLVQLTTTHVTWFRSTNYYSCDLQLHLTHIIIHSVTSSYMVSHHHTWCHIIIHGVTSSYMVSHHHTWCHVIIHVCTFKRMCMYVCMCVYVHVEKQLAEVWDRQVTQRQTNTRDFLSFFFSFVCFLSFVCSFFVCVWQTNTGDFRSSYYSLDQIRDGLHRDRHKGTDRDRHTPKTWWRLFS